MRVSETIYLILQGFKSRKSRLIFTTLGISIGIGAILFLVSLGYGLQQLLLEQITTKESLLTLDVTPPENQVIQLDRQAIEQIKRLEGVELISPQAVLAGQASLAGINSGATINLTNSSFFRLAGIKMAEGRAFGAAQEAVANSTFLELFGLKQSDFLGRKISLTLFRQTEAGEQPFAPERQFELTGFFEAPDSPPQLYIPINSVGLDIENYQLLKVKVDQEKDMEQVRNQLLDMGFLVSALSDTIDQANRVFRGVQIVLGVFGVIALAVAALGLVNTMTISLLQRTNEIGIMRAIGASKKDIRRLFLGESVIIGFTGGVIGILLGVGFGEFFNWIVNVLAVSLGGEPVNIFLYPVWFLGFIVMLSTLVGFVAGVFPARRAAKLDPLQALRYK